MRARIVGAEALAGTAEALPLAGRSVDAVVAGQAFHWFDAARFVDEAARVLRPGGTVGVLWNEVDDRVGWVAELARIADFGAVASEVDLVPPFADDRFSDGELHEVGWAQRLDRERLVALVSSQSHTLVLPPEERAALLAEVDAFARRRLGDAELELPYLTRAWRFVLR
jgi:SAM-dependent methyltransferase